jgi:hypothetical protein
MAISIETVPTKKLITELINRDKAETDNEGQFVIYTGLYITEADVTSE